MKGDAFFFLGIIAFFFILWYASGGPTKPISFAGPYITPITNVDTVQQGYGDAPDNNSIWANITGLSAIENSLAGLQRSSSEIRAFGNPSPYKGQVTVSSASGAGATRADEEYVTIRNSGSAPVTISGWRLVSGASGRGEDIPWGAVLPKKSGVNDLAPIVLAPGEEAAIVTGESPIGDSFKENKCAGYLAKSQKFVPSIQTSCPSAVDEFDRYFTGNELKDDKCYQLVQSTPSCTTPRESSGLSSSCRRLVDDQLSYAGCVDTHRYESDFYGTTWHIYLEHEKDRKQVELWKSSRDAVKLLDENGLTVDLYTY
ncbi:MAG: hypothetical protein AB199_00330 [Parcubacteria bacterium C7867-004]|nr:MAG: hypothetical protein AB199_00330 [Parcubacteria bacterium C7867-004]